jgi:histidinol-phosphate aminotransferase
MTETEKLVRDNVRKLIPYSCARDEYDGGEGIFLDANENPFGHLNRYPDPYHRKLREAVSRLKGLPVENIFTGNGSDEIIDLCYRIFCNPGRDKALIFHPTYGMYEVSAAANDIEVIKLSLDENFNLNISAVEPYFKDVKLKLIFICSPNNPTGNSMNSNDIEFIIRNFKGIVIIDEAYIEFSGHPSFSLKIMQYPNLVVMQTFSKALGLAAARIGIAFAGQEIINYLFRLKPPYNISTINQAAALKKLDEINESRDQVKKIIEERNGLVKSLAKLKVVEKIYPSDANFLLVRVMDADHIYNMLLEKGIIVRNRSMMINNCLRITVGTANENRRMISELEKITL